MSPSSPSPGDARTPEVRQALMAQAAHLLDEVAALRLVLPRVPEAVLSGRPLPDDRSIKELYGSLITTDEAFLRYLDRLGAGTAFSVSEEALSDGAGWNELPLDVLLTRLSEGRKSVLDRLERLDAAAWFRTGTTPGEQDDVYEALFHLIQHGAERMRQVAYRLHESRLSDRPGGLPR